MFLTLYETCVAIFLLQGIALPWLVVLSGLLWWKQAKRLERLRADIGTAGGAANGLEAVLASLPKLSPLHCGQCGSGLLIRENDAYCQACRTSSALPSDYRSAGRLVRDLKKLTAIASRRWRIARVLVSTPAIWFFRAMILIEPFVIFPITLIGSNTYRDTWFDRTLSHAGGGLTFVLFGSAFLGFVIWMLLFVFLALLSKDLKRKLPALPKDEAPPQGIEMADCLSCGGAIEYGETDWGCVCSYCKVENLRPQFLRAERVRGERRKSEVRTVLFRAMQIIDDFIGTFFFVLLFLVGSALIYTATRLV